MTDVSVPLMDWFKPELPPVEPVVWWSRLDKRYQVEVVRTGDSSARLRIFDHGQDDRVLVDEPVVLAYGAIFGPDVSDVVGWQTRALYVADHREEFPVQVEKENVDGNND